ncbi:MAG: hypothetical protein QM753_02195 [Thermomicrobiales bacterium]
MFGESLFRLPAWAQFLNCHAYRNADRDTQGDADPEVIRGRANRDPDSDTQGDADSRRQTL